ncbi:alpha/beta hydrolase [Paenibacillus sp. GSMTC-2017]|nr:alpha/beta hydrolase [Paenibacillus sp. GSMTC-2017]
MAYDYSNEKIVKVNGIELATETFGDPQHPAILLIQGAGNSMISWAATICQTLANAGNYVIRYDSRDTGRSTSYEVGNPSYELRDLLADALAILEKLDIKQSHIVGLSQGSAIAQLLAINYPDRVTTITLISSTPGGPGHQATDLSPMHEGIAKIFTGEAVVPEPDWDNRESVANYLVEGERPFAGGGTFDEDWIRDTALHIFDRTVNLAAQLTNPFLLDAGTPWREQLSTITTPTLVIHGTTDPLFPLDHGEALAREIPNAKLLTLKDVGHAQLPRNVWDIVTQNIIEHVSR